MPLRRLRQADDRDARGGSQWTRDAVVLAVLEVERAVTQLSIAGTVGYILSPDADPDRDTWCTPRWLTDLLPRVDVDPASNPRSTVRADRSYMLETGENGLELPWGAMTFCNPPYGNVLPWAMRLQHEVRNGLVLGAAFLVNADHSTRWWKQLSRLLPNRLDFDQRIQFVAPPGAEPSTNNKPQSLLLNDAFLAECSSDLLVCGTLWRRT